jgi:hypothetical protein
VAGNGRAAPGMNDPVEVLGAGDLNAVVEGQRCAGSARSHRPLRPVGTLDEEHILGLPPKRSVTVDPEQATGVIADRDDQSALEGMADQQMVDGGENERKRMLVAILPQVVIAQILDRHQGIGVDVQLERSLPRLLDESPDARNVLVITDQLVMCARDGQVVESGSDAPRVAHGTPISTGQEVT